MKLTGNISDLIPSLLAYHVRNLERLNGLKINNCVKNDKKINITHKDYDLIVPNIKKYKLQEYVKSNLNEIGLNFPQTKLSEGEHLCNEQIYSEITFISVYGLMKI